MVDIVLVEPEIPNNTGAIARTCACTGSRLHLVKPLGFDISDRAVKRAGLDYWHLVDISVYENIDEYFAKNGDENLFLSPVDGVREGGEERAVLEEPDGSRRLFRSHCRVTGAKDRDGEEKGQNKTGES